MQRAKGRTTTDFVFRECYFRFKVRKNSLFILVFFNAGLVEPVQFGLIGFRF